MKRPDPRSQHVSAAVLATLIKAATAYADDLESGLADGTYSDRADLDAVRWAIERVAPMPRTPAERREAKAAGYAIVGGGGVFHVIPPAPGSNLLAETGETQSEAWDVAFRHMQADRGRSEAAERARVAALTAPHKAIAAAFGFPG